MTRKISKEEIARHIEADELGIIDATLYLGYIYHTDPKHKNITLAIKYYKKAAEINLDHAINNLATIYHTDPKHKNIPLAIDYYIKAIKLGFRDSMKNLLLLARDNHEEVVKYYNSKIITLEEEIEKMQSDHRQEIEELLKPDGRFVEKSIKQYNGLFKI